MTGYKNQNSCGRSRGQRVLDNKTILKKRQIVQYGISMAAVSARCSTSDLTCAVFCFVSPITRRQRFFANFRGSFPLLTEARRRRVRHSSESYSILPMLLFALKLYRQSQLCYCKELFQIVYQLATDFLFQALFVFFLYQTNEL